MPPPAAFNNGRGFVSSLLSFEHRIFLLLNNSFSSEIRRTAEKLRTRINPSGIQFTADRPGSIAVRARDYRSGGTSSNLGDAGSRLEDDFTFQSPRGPDFSFFQHYHVKG